MDAESGYEVQNEEHFWHGMAFAPPRETGAHSADCSVELFKIVNADCDNHEDIDDVLRSYLAFTTQFKRTSRELYYDGTKSNAD